MYVCMYVCNKDKFWGKIPPELKGAVDTGSPIKLSRFIREMYGKFHLITKWDFNKNYDRVSNIWGNWDFRDFRHIVSEGKLSLVEHTFRVKGSMC